MALFGDEYRDGAQRTEQRVFNRRAVTRRIPCCEDDCLPADAGRENLPCQEWRCTMRDEVCCIKKQMNGIALLLLGILFAMAGGQLDLLGLTGIGLLMGIFGAGIVYWNSGET